MTKRPSKHNDEAEDAPGTPGPIRREALERANADMSLLLEEQEFESVEEANAFIQKLLADTGGRIPEQEPRFPAERAQHLCWEAWGEADPKRAAALARKALRLDEDCADAYNLLAEFEAGTTHAALRYCEKGVEAGKRSLGEAFFEEHRGHFWGLQETRPYMRAREGLAAGLWAMERRTEAIDHFEAMLELNPGDNQGVRGPLLSIYLEEDRVEDASALVDRYEDDAMVEIAWGQVLVRFLQGEDEQARAALADALEVNAHVPAYLLGQRPVTGNSPQYVDWGGPDQAEAYAHASGYLWKARSNALDWLGKQVT